MSQEQLTLKIWNPIPVDNAAITTPAGGTWSADTYSFLVAAWFYDDETDIDYAGWSMQEQAEWNNIAVAVNDKVVIDWTAAEKRPDHYSVYFQSGSSYNLEVSGVKIAEIDGSLSSCTIPDPTSLGTCTFARTPPSITINPVIQMEPVYRDTMGRGYDGKLLKLAYGQDIQIIELGLVLSMVSTTRANYRRLQKWIERCIRILISDPGTATPDEDPFYASLIGYFVATDYTLSTMKNRRSEIVLRFMVESGTVLD